MHSAANRMQFKSGIVPQKIAWSEVFSFVFKSDLRRFLNGHQQHTNHNPHEQ